MCSYTSYINVCSIGDFKQRWIVCIILQATVLPSGTATSKPGRRRSVLREVRASKKTTRAADEISNIASAVQQPQATEVSIITRNSQ